MFANISRSLLICALILVGVLSCKRPTPPPPKPPSKPTPHLVKLKTRILKKLSFKDKDPQSLKTAISRSLIYYNRLPDKKIIKIPDKIFHVADFKDSFEKLSSCLQSNSCDWADFLSLFDFYVYTVKKESGRLLVTGYYEPIIEGSLKRTEVYKYPVYPLPKNIVKVVLSDFGVRCAGRNILVGRLAEGRLVPFFSRREIDNGALDGLQPLFWAKDPVDVFFLQIQGSGVVKFPDGKIKRIGYAGTNGHPYRSIGKYMIENGLVSKEAMSMQAIRKFFRENPRKMWEILWHNASYVFFRWVKTGPRGSIGVLLTPLRSVASDPRFYPPGSLGFLITTIPSGKGFKSFSRWILHQDRGGAIKGPWRLDLFFGTGDTAGDIAGRMKYGGTLILALPKFNKSESQN